MNEGAIDDLFNHARTLGYKDSRDNFINLIHTDQRAFNDMFSYARSKGFNEDEDSFSVLIGKKKGGLGKPTPGSEAGPSGGRRLPSKLNVQQVKTYLGKYGASFTDDQYRQIAEQAAGKSLEEAMSIARNIVTPQPKVAPMAPLEAGRQMLETASAQRTGLAEQVQAQTDEMVSQRGYLSPEQLQGEAMGQGAMPSSTIPTMEQQRIDFATGFRKEGEAEAADVVAKMQPISKKSLLAKYAEEAREKESDEIDLGPFGSVKMGDTPEEVQRKLDQLITLGDPGSAEADFGFSSQQIYDQIKSNLGYENDKKLEEDLLKYFKTNEGLKYVIDDSKQKLSLYNQQYEQALQDPQSSEEDLVNLKQMINKELQIQNMGDIVESTQYDRLSLGQKTSLALAYGANTARSLLGSLELSAQEFTVGVLEAVAEPFLAPEHQGMTRDLFLAPILSEKKASEEARASLPYQSISSQSVLDGLNLLNFSTTATQVVGSMAATYAGGAMGGAALVYGDAVDEARKSGFGRDESKAYGLLNAVISGYLEKIGLKGMTKTIVSDAERRYVLSAIRSELKKGASVEKVVSIVTNKITNSLGSLMKAGTPEGVTEFAQTGQEILLKKGFNSIVLDDDKKGFEEPSLDEAAKMLTESFVVGFFSTGSVPSLISAFSKGSAKYEDAAKAVVDGKRKVSDIVETTKGLILSGKVSAADGRAFIENLKIAEASKAALPKYVKDKQQRTRAISLMMERNKLTEEMKSSDPDLQDGYNKRLTEIKQELKSIADKNWVAPTNPFVASTAPGFSAAMNALSQESDTDKAARTFNKTVGINNGLLTKLTKAMESNTEIAANLAKTVASDLEMFVNKLSSMDNKTPAMQEAIKTATDIMQKLNDYGNKRTDVSTATVGSLNMDDIIGRIAAGVDPADMDFMENVPEETLLQVADALSGIQDGMDVSEKDAASAADFLYDRYKQLSDLKAKVQQRIDSETNQTKKDRLTRSLSAINEAQSKISEDINTAVKYQQEKALRDEAAGTRTQPAVSPLSGPKAEAAPAAQPQQAQEYDPANEQEVVDDFNSKNEDQLLPGVVRAINSVAKLLAKIAPEVKFYVHTTTQGFVSALEADGVNKTAAKNSSGNTGQYISLNGKAMSVHINLEAVNREAIEMGAASRAIYHEAAHVILNKYFGSSPEVIKGMLDAVTKVIPKGISKQLDEFVANYDQNINEERIVELVEILAATEQKLDDTTISKIIKAINDFIERAANALGVQNVDRFLITDSRADFVDFVNSMARSTASGIQEISPETTKRIQKRYAVQEQAAGQVPVQPGARGGETMAEGEPEAGSEVATKASKAKAQAKEEEFRLADVLFTTATARNISEETKALVDFSKNFDSLVKGLSKQLWYDVQDSDVKAVDDISSNILDSYKRIITRLADKLGIKYITGNYFLGSWEGSFEPSMNISFKITDDTNTAALSELFNSLSEQTSQDAYIVETVAKQDEEFKKTGKVILFTGLEDGTSIYPQVRVEFSKNLNLKQKSDLAKILVDNGFGEFSIGDNFVKMSSFAGTEQDYNQEKSNFEGAITNSNLSELYKQTTEQIRQSAYIEGKKDGDKRKYNRSDVFEAFKPSKQSTQGRAAEQVAQAGEAAGRGEQGVPQQKEVAKAGNRLFNNPLREVVDIANAYFQKAFGRPRPEYTGSTKLDKERAKRISDAFIKMKHDPTNPAVKKAYTALAKETLDQYKAMLDAGFVTEINNDEPYANSQDMINDLRENKRIKIFSTESGFGDEPITDKQRRENPLLEDSGFKDINGQTMLVNDVFRAVHDFFGHSELGNSFGPKGEENAWNVHARMYSPEARKAMTTETRGQNSFVNFSGVNDEIENLRDQARALREQGREDEAQDLVNQIYSLASFADQKIGLLPEEFYTIDEADTGDVGKPGIETKASKSRVSTSYQQVAETSKYNPIKSLADTLNKLAINPNDKPVQVKASKNEGGKVRTLAMLFKDMAGSKEINFREFFNQRGNVIKGKEDALAKAVATVSDRVVEMLSLASVTYPNFQSWYKERIDMAMDIFREIDPDLKKPEDSFMFKLILAITSNGNEVKAQTDDTFKIYQNWKANKEIDYSLVRGSRAKDIKKSLKTMSNLIDIHGWKKIEDFLSRKGTVEELKAALQQEFKIDKNAIDKMVKGELATENVPFSLIIGPKLGSFWNNLNGDFNTVTMDRWFMRTFGRLTNTQIVKVTKENIKNREIRLLDAVSSFRSTAEGKKFINETGIRPLLSKPKELSISLAKYFADAENRLDIIEDSPLDELRKAANNLYKVSDGFELIEAPENGSHRRFIRQAMMSAIDRFNSQSDRKTNPAETQAILWYLEKKIHEEYGSIQKESDPDYASAAEAIAIRELGKGSVSFRPSELIGGRAGLGEGQRQLSGATGAAAETEAQGKPGIETKASKARAAAEPKYEPDNINQGKPQLDLQTRIYDAAAKAWEVAKTKAKYEQGPMISSAVLDETGLDLGDIELATLIKDLILGKRPEYRRSDTGKYERVGTRKDRSAVLTRVIAALEQMMTDRRVNKSIMSSLLKAVKGDTTYTVENQTEVEMIVDAIFNSVNGISDVETGNALLALAMNAKGGIRAFMFGRIANEAWDKARETKDLELRQAYRDIGNAALNTLSTEATDAGRFNSIIYRLQQTNPEFIVEFEANKVRNQTEQGISDANKKKDKVNEMAKDLNNAQTQAAQQAAQSPSVQAAVNAATGGPSTQPQTPPAQKSKSQQQAQQQTNTSSPKPSAQVDNRIKELKNLLKNKFGGIQTKAARTAPAGLDPDILDIITELAENYIKKGITDPTALIAKVNADVVAAGGSLSSAYYNQMWSNVSTAATAMQNDMNASSLAGRIVGRVKQRVRPTPKSFDPIAELIDELLNKATEDLAPLPKKTPESRLDKLTRLISQYYDAKDMWEASKAKVEQRIDDLDPMKFSAADKQAMKDMLDKFFANDLSYFEIKQTPTPGAAATVDKMIREQMKEKKIAIEKILLEANTKQAQTKDEFIDQIVADIVAATGISSARATAIARSFAEQYDKIVTKKQEAVLKRRLPLSKTFEKFKRKSNAQRAFEAIKYGMIDPSIQIYDQAGNIIDTTKLFCEMFDIPYLDNETRDALTMFAEAIAETPPGILRQQVLNDMAMFMKMHQYKTQGSIGDRFLAQTYANLLTSTDTMVKAFNSNIIMYNFEFATQAVRSAAKGDFRMIPLLTRAYYGKKGVGKIWTETATKEMTDPDGFKINPGEDYYKLKDGSFISLANPKVAALSGHYEGLLRYSMGINQARAVLNNIVMAENFTNNVTGEVYRKYAKTKVGRTWGEYVTLAQRGLGALDALTTAAATNARFGDLLFDAIKFYAKKEGQKVSGREISDIVNNIQGTKPLIQLDALNTAILEMEQKFGAPVNLKDKAKKALLLSRAEEIVKDKMKDRIQQAVTTYPWLSELDQGQVADMMDMSYEVATKIGMMGTPPGTGGVLSSMLGFMGRYVRFSNIQYGTFTNAPVNAAMFILQGNSPIGALITGVRLIKSQRGFALGGETAENLYKQSGIRTKMYGKSVIDKPIFGQYFSFTWNLEKQDMLTRFALIQGPVIAATYMAGNAVVAALASSFGDDEEEKERLVNDGIKAIGKIDQKERILRFFGDKLSSDPKKREGVWKSIPVYATGAMYGYSGGGYGKMQSMKAMYGIEPYTVYAYGKRILSYRDNPVLGAMFMQMAASTDAMLFTENAELGGTQHGLIMASVYSQLNLVRDQSNLRSISELFEFAAGQRAYEGIDGFEERAKMYLSKTAGNIINNAIMPAELKNLNQDVNAVLGNYMDDPKEFLDFVVYRWPIISSAVIEGDKTGPFGYPLKTQPKRVFPIGLEQFKMPLMLNGSLNIPTVDELLSTEDATYTNLFIRNDNDTFLNPKISGYYKVDDYGDYVRETFTLEQRKQIREEYKILMRQFAEQNIDVNTPFDFKINLSMFLSFYEDVGYQRYIVNKVLGSDAKSIVIDGGDALINMGVDEMLFQKIESGMKQFEPRE